MRILETPGTKQGHYRKASVYKVHCNNVKATVLPVILVHKLALTQPVSQSVIHSVGHSVSQLLSQPISQSVGRSVTRSISLSSQSVSK